MSAWLCRFDYLILVISAWHVGPRVAGLVYLIWCDWAAMVTLGPSLWVIRYGLVNGDCWLLVLGQSLLTASVWVAVGW